VALAGANSYTGTTTVASGTLRLDYTTQDNSKLADASALILSGAMIELAGGSHLEQVASATVSGDAQIARSSGSSVLALGALTVSGSLRLSADDVASTTSTNVNGMLGGVTVVSGGAMHFAANSGVSDGGGGALIRAYSGGYSDIDRLGGILPDDPALNARIINGGVSGNVTLAAFSNRVNTLTMDADKGPSTLNLSGGVLALGGEAGGVLLQTSFSGGLTIGVAAGDGTLAVGGTPNSTSAALVLANDSAASDLTINAAIPNNGNDTITLIKAGAGKVILSGTNTYSGTTRITGGILQIGSGGLTGQSGTGTLLNDGQLVFARGTGSADLTVTPSIYGSGSVVQSGAANSRVILRGADSGYSGGTVVNGAILRGEDTGDTQILQLGTGPITLNGGTLEVRANGGGDDLTIVTGDGVTGNNVMMSANATLDCTQYNGTHYRNTIRFNNLTFGGSQLTYSGSYRYRCSFAGTVTLTNNVTFNTTLDNTEAWLALDGRITDNGSGYGITKLGAGTLFINGNNTYSGGTILGNLTANTVFD
jgi:autotransporter-associated beta strand protein